MDIFDRVLARSKDVRLLTRAELFKVAGGEADEELINRLPATIRRSAVRAREWEAIIANEHVSLGEVYTYLLRGESHAVTAFYTARAKFHAASCTRCRPFLSLAADLRRVGQVVSGSNRIQNFFSTLAPSLAVQTMDQTAATISAYVLDSTQQPVFDNGALRRQEIRLVRAILDTEGCIRIGLEVPARTRAVWIGVNTNDSALMLPEAEPSEGRVDVRVDTNCAGDYPLVVNSETLTVWLIVSG